MKLFLTLNVPQEKGKGAWTGSEKWRGFFWRLPFWLILCAPTAGILRKVLIMRGPTARILAAASGLVTRRAAGADELRSISRWQSDANSPNAPAGVTVNEPQNCDQSPLPTAWFNRCGQTYTAAGLNGLFGSHMTTLFRPTMGYYGTCVVMQNAAKQSRSSATGPYRPRGR